MKKILFTIQWYPSLNSANVLCDIEIINELKKDSNLEIHILALKAGNQPNEEIIDNLHIHRFRFSALWKLYTWSRLNPGFWLSPWIYKIGRVFLRIKQLLYIPIYPCIEPHLRRAFANEAIKLHKTYKFDLVVSEHSGIETLYAGFRLKVFDEKIKYCIIFWDPIVGKTPAKYLPIKYANRKLAIFERTICNKADAVISMATNLKYLQEHIDHESYYEKVVFFDLPRLVKPQVPNIAEKYTKKGFINIVFAGIIVGRNIEKVIEVIDSCNIPNINLILFCNTNISKAKLELKNITLSIYPYISRNELFAVYHNADFLLNLGASNPNMLPSKIFEYMSFGKPIISTYYIDNDCTNKYLEHYPLSYMLNLNRDCNTNEFRDYINQTINQTIDFKTVSEIFPFNTPMEYVNLINELLKRKTSNQVVNRG